MINGGHSSLPVYATTSCCMYLYNYLTLSPITDSGRNEIRNYINLLYQIK